jgi:hypothetical protein
MNYTEFIQSAGISMRAERADSNPNMDSVAPMDHWKCHLRAGRSRMTVHFSMGVGHNGREPELSNVLGCLASDASGVENASGFEDWCAEYGYDTDSRKAERTFRACEREAKRLQAFLGESAYKTLLYDVERE